MDNDVLIIKAYLQSASSLYTSSELRQAERAYQNLIIQAQDCVNAYANELDKIPALLDFVYTQQIFSLPANAKLPAAFDPLTMLLSHTGNGALIAMLLSDLLKSCGLQATPILAGQKLLVRVDLGENNFVFLEGSQGQSLEWQQIEAYLATRGAIAEIQVPDQDAQLMLLFSLYKTKCIEAGEFARALQIIDLILEQEPDNPYERRDRGFVLQQLDCDFYAVEDYKFFVEKCPSDPSAQVVQFQLENINNNIQSIH